MSQPSVGKTLAPYSAESKINVRLIARGHVGGYPRNISEATDLAGPMPFTCPNEVWSSH